ncbi:MAG: hypothetical protein CME06_14965 [Gemmatimonadetes bacterium]|nr:hypothetical protein [Gemmatimonadota bacterium]
MSSFLLGIRLGVTEIAAHRFRSGLSMLGIVIGVASVIAAVSIGEGMRDSVISQLGEVGAADQVNVRGEPRWVKREGDWRRNPEPEQLTWQDVRDMDRERSRGRVKEVLPEVTGTLSAAAGRVSRSVSYLGLRAGGVGARKWHLQSGRGLAPLDAGELVCLIGSEVARDFFPGATVSSILGREIRLGPLRLVVVGVLAERGTSIFRDTDDVVVLPIETAQRRLTRSDHLSRIVLQLRSPADAPEVERSVRAVLIANHKGGADFRVDREEAILERIANVTLLINLTLGGIAGISLLVGGIGIMNIMLASVTERTREIGIRKAIGAANRDVMAQFLMEASTVTVVGGAIGALCGVGLGRGLAGAIATFLSEPVEPRFPVPVLLLAIFFSGGVGLFFGLMPARRAAAMDPIESLRTE